MLINKKINIKLVPQFNHSSGYCIKRVPIYLLHHGTFDQVIRISNIWRPSAFSNPYFSSLQRNAISHWLGAILESTSTLCNYERGYISLVSIWSPCNLFHFHWAHSCSILWNPFSECKHLMAYPYARQISGPNIIEWVFHIKTNVSDSL